MAKTAKTVLKELAERGHTVTLEQLSEAVGKSLTERSLISQPVEELEAHFKGPAEVSEATVSDLEDDSSEPLPEDDETSETSQEVTFHRPTTPGVPQPKQAVYTKKDLWLAGQLRNLQRKCRRIGNDSFEDRVREDRPFKVYRPKYDPSLVEHEGESFYAYDSILEGDGKILISLEESEHYMAGGVWQYRHMPFVSDQALEQFMDLLKQYSFYTEVCVVGKEPLNTELDRKARLLVQQRFNPPAWSAVIYQQLERGKIDQDMYNRLTRRGDLAFPEMCYQHWMMQADMDIIRREWMELTLELQQNLSGEEFKDARQRRLVSLITTLRGRLNERQKERGGRPVTHQQVAEMLINFAETVSR